MTYLIFLFRSAIEDFLRNKGRTFLTSLGILIGVLSVVLLTAFGLGLKKYIEQQFETLGKNLLIVLPGQGFSQNGGQGLIGGIQFDEKDVLKLKRIKGVEQIAPFFTKTLKIEYRNKSQITTLLATTGDAFKVINLEVAQGSLFTNADNEKAAKVVILGADTASKLFGSVDNVVGKSVRVQTQRYIVKGVLKKQGGGALGSEIDSRSIVPFRSTFAINPNKKYFAIYIKAGNNQDIQILKNEVKKVLQKRYNADDFSVTEETELLSTINSIFSILNTILVAIAAISLVVGGIGIMNIMYVTVTERIREIGIRRAIGARKSDILSMFLLESVALSLLGGLFGLLLAYIIVILIQPLFPAYIDLGSVILALGVSSAIGIIFGVFPAKKASDLSPMDAIRYE